MSQIAKGRSTRLAALAALILAQGIGPSLSLQPAARGGPGEDASAAAENDSAVVPQGSRGRLSAGQAASILGPLRTAVHSAPTLEVYSRILQVWDHCEARPAEGDVQAFAEGVSLFPRGIGLAHRSAVVCAKNGYSVVAARLVSSGLLFATDERDREKLEQLRAAMTVPRVPGSR